MEASRQIFFHANPKPNHIYNPSHTQITDYNTTIPSNNTIFEFDESEIWNMSNQQSHAISRTTPSKAIKVHKKTGLIDRAAQIPAAASSLAVNIPDWSKILRCDRDRVQHGRDSDGDDEECEDDENSWIPPHEFLARKRGASFSVHEGIGRTLKGSDLRRVRNAIWKQVGFEG